MKSLFGLLLWSTIVLVGHALPEAGQAAEPPLKIIFDTDVDHDCDDIGALFMLHGAVERGQAHLLATMGCTSSVAIAPCLDAINTWFGRPEIPVGTLKDESFLDHKGFANEIIRHYPHKHASGQDYPDAVTLYRQTLAKQPDATVVVLAVGPLRNLANLLKSRPDEASPLDGPALIAKKVKRLEIMGGTYPPMANTKEGEWNFKQDPAAAGLVCSTWPTPVVFNGEGGSTNSGRRVTYEMPEHNPLTMAYRLYPGVGFAGDRLSWDSVSALVALRGAEPWYKVVSGGTNVTDPVTGINVWQSKEDRQHSFLVLKARKPEIETAIEDMQTRGKGRPKNLKFDINYYADSGMCQITFQGQRDKQGQWQDQAAESWIQYQHADGRKRLVTSYAVVCNDQQRLPRALELLGSNDGGASWTRLDLQAKPGFSAETHRREFTIAQPAKWNAFRLQVTADDKAGIRIESIELLEAIDCRPGVAVASLVLDQKQLSVPADGRATLNATIAPLHAFEREITWVSSDANVAEVKQIGEQTAMVVGKRPGVCTLTATINNLQQTCAVTVRPSTLPKGWRFDELNSPPIPGSIVIAGDKFMLTGCGHAMTSWWERVRDQGAFVSQAVKGDVTIAAQLNKLAPNVGGPTYQWDNRPPSVAGLMIRESLTEKCGRFFLVQVEASGNLVCRWRNKTGDQDDNQKEVLGKVTLPLYLRLTQSDGHVHVFTSVDGKIWDEPKMTHAATFDDRSRIGIFTCSGNTFATTTAVFDKVHVSK
ncbi:nucleoside hydrolase [Anatilimnocola aggregata]|nr:nucleoside hydrolase [Anatilimnocola aggregata]